MTMAATSWGSEEMFGQDIPCIDFDLDLGRQQIRPTAYTF
jgi:hypothetical protein